MIPDSDRAARRIFNRIFVVEHRPDSSFVLKLRKSGEVVGGGWSGPLRQDSIDDFLERKARR